MIPQYVRKVAPQYTLPGGQMAVANVGVGNALAQLGGQIQVAADRVQAAAERKLVREDSLAVSRSSRDSEQRLLDYFLGIKDRREELSRTQVDPVTGSTVTGYQVEIEGFGRKLDEEFARATADLSPRAKEEFEKRFNARAPMWGKFAAETLSHLELEDIDIEIQDLAKTDRVADAKELFELYSDRYSRVDRQRLEAAIEEGAVQARLSSARAYLQNAASAQGWEAAITLIDDPDWQKAMGLDIADSARVHNDLSTFARTQEGKETRAATAEHETARNNLFADGMQDKLAPSSIDPALRAGIVTPAEAKQLQELVTKGPATENDPDSLRTINRMIDGLERGEVQTHQVIAEIDKNAAKLTPAKRDSLIERATNVFGFQNRALTDTRRFAITQLITVNESMLERLYAMGTATDVLKPIEDRRAFEYRLVEYVEDQLSEWMRDHPAATPDDVQVQGRRLISQVRDTDHTNRRALLEAWEQLDLPAASPWEGPNEGIIPLGAPEGLEPIWGRMSDQDRAEALRLLAAGHRPEDLVEAFVP